MLILRRSVRHLCLSDMCIIFTSDKQVVYLHTYMTLRDFLTVYILSFLLLLFAFGFSVVYAHGDEEHNELPSKVNVCHTLSEFEKDRCYVALCEEGVDTECVEDIVEAAVLGSGSKFALAVLTDISASPSFLSDGYGFARKIGQTTAREYGLSGEVFFRCSDDFHYGCYYGFFEEIMAQQGLAPLEAATAICSSVDLSQGEACYHTMGHMFMKHSGRTFDNALSLCDSLAFEFQAPCWDGVFMEGVNEALADDLVPEGYFAEHPLSPCNTVAERYQEPCYRNHGRHLIEYFQGSANDALSVCSGADRYRAVCEHSVTDASEGVSHHHMHDDTMLVSVETEESVSWFQKILNFILPLLGIEAGITVISEYDVANSFGTESLIMAEERARTVMDDLERRSSEFLLKALEEKLDFPAIEEDLDKIFLERTGFAKEFVSRALLHGIYLEEKPEDEALVRTGWVDRELAEEWLRLTFAFPERSEQELLGLFRESVREKGISIEPERTVVSAPVSTSGSDVIIVYRDGKYIPDTVRISVGQEVVWVNESQVFWPASDLHPTHKKYPGSTITKCGTPERESLFDACEAMAPGAEYSFVFTEVGEWAFHDHINPRAQGVVIVSE